MCEKAEKLNKLAKDVLILSRNTLLVNLRFLDAALSQFEFFPIEESSLLTDGKHILYNPRHILENYRIAKEIPVRDYLHMVMHCVFRHMYMDPSLNRPYWDLACDIAVENVITELGLKITLASREGKQARYIAAIKQELKYVTAEKIYAYLRLTATAEVDGTVLNLSTDAKIVVRAQPAVITLTGLDNPVRVWMYPIGKMKSAGRRWPTAALTLP